MIVGTKDKCYDKYFYLKMLNLTTLTAEVKS